MATSNSAPIYTSLTDVTISSGIKIPIPQFESSVRRATTIVLSGRRQLGCPVFGDGLSRRRQAEDS
jgi:hypothetical protein